MTKQELKQVFYINNELRMWRTELENLESKIEETGKWIDGMPRGSGTSDKVGNLATELANFKLMIGIKEVELQIQKNKIIQYIDSIDDSLIRQIVFYRCVLCMGWGKVADLIGGEATYHSVRMIFNRHIGGSDED